MANFYRDLKPLDGSEDKLRKHTPLAIEGSVDPALN